jgi:hypothetical protein
MKHHAVLVLSCIILISAVQAAVPLGNINCTSGVTQNVSPKGMGMLETYAVFDGSVILLDGEQWRDAATGEKPPVGFPGVSDANVTSGFHTLKISLEGYRDVVANVSICDGGLTEVDLVNRQVPVETSPTIRGTGSSGTVPSAAGTGSVPATTRAPGFEFMTAMLVIAGIVLGRKAAF